MQGVSLPCLACCLLAPPAYHDERIDRRLPRCDSRGSCGGYWDLVNAVANLLDYGVVSEQCLPYAEPPPGAPPACGVREGCQVLPPGVWGAVVLNTTSEVRRCSCCRPGSACRQSAVPPTARQPALPPDRALPAGLGRTPRLAAPQPWTALLRSVAPPPPNCPWPAQVKQHIVRWGAVLTGIYIRDELWGFWGSGQPGVYKAAAPRGSPHQGGHGLMVYGYDDQRRFWRAKNRQAPGAGLHCYACAALIPSPWQLLGGGRKLSVRAQPYHCRQPCHTQHQGRQSTH
jgi:hypothetical protein